MIKPQPGILQIDPYVGGKAKTEDGRKVMKLSANESALGPSPKAMEAYAAMVAEVHRYPEGGSTDLRSAIAGHYGLDVNRVVCGSGSDEIIAFLCQAYLGQGDEILYSDHGFLMYKIGALLNGATPVEAPETEYTADVDNLLAAVTERTRIVFIANPNNPTGTYLPMSEVKRLQAGLPENCLLVLDAAYAEFVQRNDYEAGIELVSTCQNVIMTRTFSKIYGLGGLRVGWAYCPEHVADVLNRVRGPFNVNSAAQAAAEAAIKDLKHMQDSIIHNTLALNLMHNVLRRLGLFITESVGNFVLARFPNETGKTADDAFAFLESRDIIARKMSAYKLPDCLRITIGNDVENAAVIDALEAFMGEDR